MPVPAATPESHQVRHVSPGELDAIRFDEATRRIRELAEDQHGVVSRHQLLDLGIGKGLIDDRLDSGHLISLHRGVFALGHARLSKRGRWMGAVLASSGVLSHDSAAELWDLRRSREITVSRLSGGASHEGFRVRQVQRLTLDDTTVEFGIPVTTVERTLVDIAGALDGKQIERALVAAGRSRRLRWPELERAIFEGFGRSGIGRLRKAAQEVDPRSDDTRSALEVDFLGLCRYFDIPLPQVNVLVAGNLVDFLWPAERVVVETDGYAYHGDRAAFEADHERDVELEEAGCRVLRATWRMLDRSPGRFMRLLDRVLEDRINFAR
jgi:hypothetical protein